MIDTLRILIPIIIAHACVLAGIVFVIKKILLGDTMRAVNMMKQVEAEVRKKEEGIRRKIDEHEKDFNKRKEEAEEQMATEKEAAMAEVNTLREKTVADAKAEGEKIIDQARKNEEKMKRQIEIEMEEKTVDYAGQVFKLVFSEKTNAALNKEFIAELLDALDEIEAGSITVDSSSAEFISSHPIDPDQKTRLEGLLKDKFEADVKVEEQIQEDILAGLILKMGSLEIDGSLINRYQEAVAEVKKGM